MNAILPSALLLVPAFQETAAVRPTLADDASIELHARWEPCKRSKYGLFAETEVLRAPKPAEERRVVRSAELAPFLPQTPVAVGDTWAVPPEAVLPLLRQFHPGARAELHHGFGAAPGTFACLRAASNERLELLFRAHAEFELEGGVTYTPAQFEGRLVLDRKSGAPLALRIALPDRDTNVDVNVPSDSDDKWVDADGNEVPMSMFADIGWVPVMELAGGTLGAAELDAHAYADALPLVAARKLLARRFYPFERLDWLPFAEAVHAARELGKPLHVVVLFGTLDDESC